MVRSRELYLWDIAAAIKDVQGFIQGQTLQTFTRDLLVSTAVERKFEVIGEALKQMEAYFPGSTKALPKVKAAIGMRDRLAHGYFTVDRSILWKALSDELPDLLTAVNRELAPTPDTTALSDKTNL